MRAHTFPLRLLEKLHWHSQVSPSFTYFVSFFFHAKKVQLHCAWCHCSHLCYHPWKGILVLKSECFLCLLICRSLGTFHLPTTRSPDLSTCSSDHYVTLQEYFSHPSLVIYFFPNPPIKLKLGLQIGGRLLIAKHLDQSLWSANQKQGAVVRSYLLHTSLTGVRFCCAFSQIQQTMQNCWAKTNLLSQASMIWLFFIQF